MNEQILKYSQMAKDCNLIDPALYAKYEVKRGLRDISGKGVLAGLTEISQVISYITKDDEMIPCEGCLRYRGIDVKDLVQGFINEDRFGFEETAHLLLFGKLPTQKEYDTLCQTLNTYRTLPEGFVRDTIMNTPSKDMMNILSKSVLTLYAYDRTPDNIDIPNIVRQSLELIAQFPLLAVYGYSAYAHAYKKKSLVIHSPLPNLSTAENILHMLRPNNKYTKLEAQILDLALMLHAEHGGGNNSTFTTHVVSSSGTDTYSSTVASLASLKGPRHGGANIKVVHMFEEIKQKVKNWTDDDEVAAYITKILNKEAFDHSGLVYGVGHAVYSLSDPRSLILKDWLKQLAEEKGFLEEFRLYEKVEQIAPEIIGKQRKIYKGVSANVDFFSGFMYHLLGIPEELYTPLFAVARIVGWSAHRIEEIVNNGKIIRPAYKSVAGVRDYVPMENR